MQTQGAERRGRNGGEIYVSMQAFECTGGSARGELGMRGSEIRRGNDRLPPLILITFMRTLGRCYFEFGRVKRN